MLYNEKYKCWVSKEGFVYTLNGVYNQTGYHGDGTLKIRKPYKRGLYYYWKGISLHRLVWETFNGEIPTDMEIDHIDRDKSNNKLSNLRCVSHKENCQNRENKVSEQTKQKISKSKKGHTVSQETREKIRAKKLGTHWELVNGKRIYTNTNLEV